MSPPQRPHTRARRETPWRLVCCCTRRHKKGASQSSADPTLVHARRIFTDRISASSCTGWASSRHRGSTARRGTRSHRSGGGRNPDRRRTYPGSRYGNLPKPGTRPHGRFCHPQHSSARVHILPVVRQRTCPLKRIAEWPRPVVHVLARRILARPLQCLALPEQRLRYPYRYRLAPGPRPHHAVG